MIKQDIPSRIQQILSSEVNERHGDIFILLQKLSRSLRLTLISDENSYLMTTTNGKKPFYGHQFSPNNFSVYTVDGAMSFDKEQCYFQ